MAGGIAWLWTNSFIASWGSPGQKGAGVPGGFEGCVETWVASKNTPEKSN
tara:strand:+ start:893 stop:1042 length:150 start_codon:yes stop_codon:yes gene_type:complete